MKERNSLILSGAVGLLSATSHPPEAWAGITGKVSGQFHDPCAMVTGAPETPQCSAALSAKYLNRCLVNYEGDGPNLSCNAGSCEGWNVSGRSFLMSATVTYPYNASCTTTVLRRIGRSNSAMYCINTLGGISALSINGTIWNNKWIVTKPAASSIPSLPINTRISVRGYDGVGNSQLADPLDKSNPYLYSLTLQDAVCTWQKYCDPATKSLKAGVTFEELPNSLFSATSLEPEHPIRRMCKLSPNWYMGNAALSCAITQNGGIDALCAKKNPLDTNPGLGLP